MNIDNKYIGYALKNNKVVFKVDDKVYIKMIKEKNKVMQGRFVFSESIRIICNDLNDDYVIVDSNNKTYYNKILLLLNILLGLIFSALLIINIFVYEHISIYEIMSFILFSFIILFQVIYFNYLFKKKKYKNCMMTANGKIIDYGLLELTNHGKVYAFDHRVMYKYKISNNIIHSVVNDYDAKFRFKDYPVDSNVLIRYNQNNCCESCLGDEYDYFFNSIKKEHKFLEFRSGDGIITNIKTKYIDEEMDEDLKEYFIVDFVECEYVINSKNYKNYSIFCVVHNRYKIGDKINIMYDNDDKNNFYCS